MTVEEITNLALFELAVSGMTPLERSAFVDFFVAALYEAVPPEVWLKAIIAAFRARNYRQMEDLQK